MPKAANPPSPSPPFELFRIVFIFLIRDYCLVKQSNRYRRKRINMRYDSITGRLSGKLVAPGLRVRKRRRQFAKGEKKGFSEKSKAEGNRDQWWKMSSHDEIWSIKHIKVIHTWFTQPFRTTNAGWMRESASKGNCLGNWVSERKRWEMRAGKSENMRAKNFLQCIGEEK